MKDFYTILTFHFKYKNLHACKLARLRWRKSTQVCEGVFFLVSEWNYFKVSYFIFLILRVQVNVFTYFISLRFLQSIYFQNFGGLLLLSEHQLINKTLFSVTRKYNRKFTCLRKLANKSSYPFFLKLINQKLMTF